MTSFYEAVEIAGLLTILAGSGNGIEGSGNEVKNIKIWHRTTGEINAFTDTDKGKIVFNTSTEQFGIRITGKTVYMNDLAELTGILPISKGGTGKSSVGSSNQILGVNVAGNDLEYKTLYGTANRITTSHSVNGITLSTPQDIHTGAIPTFAQGLLTTAPTDDNHIVRKQDLEAVMLGMQPKDGCTCATTSNVSLSGLQVVDGYQTVANDRVLVKNQTTASGNGVYLANAGSWTRVADLDSWGEFYCAYVFIDYGITNGDTGWRCTVGKTGTIGNTDITFVKFTSIGQIIVDATSALTKTNNNLKVNVDNVSIEVNGSNQLATKTGTRFKTFVGNIPTTAANTSITVTHGLTVVPSIIQFRKTSVKSSVFPNITAVTANDITFTFSIAVTTGTFEVVCGGLV